MSETAGTSPRAWTQGWDPGNLACPLPPPNTHHHLRPTTTTTTNALTCDALPRPPLHLSSEALDDIFMEGFAAPTVMDQLLDLVAAHPSLGDAQKGRIALALGRVDKCLADGASDTLQVRRSPPPTLRPTDRLRARRVDMLFL